MWHTVAYSGSVAFGKTGANVPAVIEQVLATGPQNGFRLLESMFLASAWTAITNTTAAFLTSPKFAAFSPFNILPLNGSTSLVSGLLVAGWPYRAPSFRPQEEVVASVNTGGTVAGQETLIVSLATTIDAVPQGEELELGYTVSVVQTANAWTLQGQPAFDTVLPEGAYAVVGSELFCTGGIAHRWLFSGQSYRPGYPSVVAPTDPQWPGVRDYRLGVAGRFSSIVAPQLETFGASAATPTSGVLRVIKVA